MVTAEDFIREVRKLAAEQPDFVYADQAREYDVPGCRNVFRDSKGDIIPRVGCIIGQAAQRLGFTGPLQVSSKTDGANCHELLDYLNVISTVEQLSWLTEVQDEQDCQTSWGDSVKAADTLMESGEQ